MRKNRSHGPGPRSSGRRRGVAAAFAALAVAGCASASGGGDGAAAVTPRSDASFYETLPAGTRFDVQLQQRLSTESSQPGDRWTAVVTRDITDGSRVLLQQGAVVAGEVTVAGPREIEGETRQVLAVVPRELRVGEQVYPIDVEVVGAEQRESRDLISRRNVAIVGGGALAGTILGEILFDEALLGGIVGATGATVLAVASSDTHVEFGEGSLLSLELERSVSPVVTRR